MLEKIAFGGAFFYVQIFATADWYISIVRYKTIKLQVEVPMNFYEAVVKFKQVKTEEENTTKSLFAPTEEKNVNRFIKEVFSTLNSSLGVNCDLRDAFSIFFWEAENGKANVMFSVDMDKADVDAAVSYIKNYLENNYDVCSVQVNDIKEITTGRFHQLGIRGDNNGLIRRYRGDESDMGLNYRENHQYQIHEELISEEKLSFDEAIEKSKKFMADDSFIEELKRIYSEENEKKYYGNPVHYKISVSNMDSAFDMVSVLAQALKSNCRLEGSRINKISEIREGCYEEDDFKNMFEKAQGNIVLFDLSGSAENHNNYANAYEDVIEYFGKLIKKNHVKTLCIFVENLNKPGFARNLLASVAEEIDIVELKEGCGNKETAINYIQSLAWQNKYDIAQEEIVEIMPDKSIFTVGEVYEIYNRWFKNGLRSKIYKSYKHCFCMEVKDSDKKSEPYDELQKMIGLTEIKKVVDEVIDNARIQKLRSQMGMDSYKTSLHMVFTGNPGSAKTTVARLMAQIFAKEGILDSGKYVECGRADLVGRYVGWTAKIVKKKFREAKGGVLFIDEAYSLVDDSNSFGDEAINTIVQEMENYRDDVIVVFAGYPNRMKEFLDKNEGLRSRIAFHMDFPDYNANEMVEILKLMADKKGYKVDSEIEEKCLSIFKLAVKQEEFGNGRFVRNLLEQAMMSQSRRISKEYKGKKISRKTLTTLKVDDFDVNASTQLEKESKRVIGFAM